MFLPLEIWSKIYLFTVVVDESRSNLLVDIRKSKKKRLLEKKYQVLFSYEGTLGYWNWLHNDICCWLNNYKPTMYIISDKMKNFYQREFDINITKNDDIICSIETNKYGSRYSAKHMWNLYVRHLKENEFDQFYISITYQH